MRKLRKVMALLLTLAMVMGMSLTAFAEAPGEAVGNTKITVKGLTEGENTTVTIYKVAGVDANINNWIIPEALQSYFTIVPGSKPASYDVDWEGLKGIVDTFPDECYTESKPTTTGEVEFSGLDLGAYLIIAAGSGETEYSAMGAATYGRDSNGLMIPQDKTVYAKGETYTVLKKFQEENGTTDKVIPVGGEVKFDIETTFPSYDEANTNRTFSITDEPSGMTITNIAVQVGGDPVTQGVDYTLSQNLPSNTAITINFTPEYIGKENAHAGAPVVVTVTATVNEAGTYTNRAYSDYDSEGTIVDGTNGSITITKRDADNNQTLTGAVFKLQNESGEDLYFVQDSDGTYILSSQGVEGAKSEIEVNTRGQITFKGLDDGTYKIVEVKAPSGYSVNNNILPVTVSEGTNISVSVDVPDTKLAELPGTGGIGTTIFTIGGCVIMIAAAGLYFASRRKHGEN